MREPNIMHIAVNVNIKWPHTENLVYSVWVLFDHFIQSNGQEAISSTLPFKMVQNRLRFWPFVFLDL